MYSLKLQRLEMAGYQKFETNLCSDRPLCTQAVSISIEPHALQVHHQSTTLHNGEVSVTNSCEQSNLHSCAWLLPLS